MSTSNHYIIAYLSDLGSLNTLAKINIYGDPEILDLNVRTDTS